MGPFEYLLTFASIVLALAVGDIVLSFHRLLAAGPRVRWDWLAPLAAFTALLKILTQWWEWYPIRAQADRVTFELFALVLAGVAVLFLLAAAALPDEVGEAGVDLRAHFDRVSRRYFLLMTLHYPLVWLFVWGFSARSDFPPFQWQNPGNLVPVLSLVLVFVRNRWAQGAFLAVLSALYLLLGAGHPLPQ